MTLLVDAGNSRLKWAVLGADGALSRHGFTAHDGAAFDTAVAAAIGAVPGIERIVVANVAGERMAQALDNRARTLDGQRCEYARVVADAGGVRIAYRDPDRLGVDRWLAMLALRAHHNRAALVVDAGTALTIDALDDDGCHLGGLIAPGYDMMRRSLVGNTARIRDPGNDAVQKRPAFFADDTGAAVMAGALYSNAALVDRAVAELGGRTGVRPAVVLTGGGAVALATAIDAESGVIDDMVLRGLAVAVTQGLTGAVPA